MYHNKTTPGMFLIVKSDNDNTDYAMLHAAVIFRNDSASTPNFGLLLE